jgi:hypothetical protein
MIRSQLGTTALLTGAPTAAEIAQGVQPSSNQTLIVYSILSATDTESSERIKFPFAGGLTQTYSQAEYQYLIDENRDEYFYGSVCIKMHPSRKSGLHQDWRYAMSPPSGVLLPTAYTV